jgi:hypothetical protein
MKFINSKSPVFTNVSINPVFQILGDDRQASRSRFVVHNCPSPIKRTTQITHIPLVHDTFPILFDKLVMDFGRADVSRIQKSITVRTSQSVGLLIHMVLYKAQ